VVSEDESRDEEARDGVRPDTDTHGRRGQPPTVPLGRRGQPPTDPADSETRTDDPRGRRLRRAFVVLTLIGLALWPPTQHVLHRAHALGAWKHFGLGVYCRPKLDLRLELVADGRTIDLRRLRPETHAAFAELRARTRELGMLTSADEAACRLMRDEDAQVVEVRRTQDELGADGRVHPRHDVWRVEDEVCSQRAYAVSR